MCFLSPLAIFGSISRQARDSGTRFAEFIESKNSVNVVVAERDHCVGEEML